MMNLKQMLKDGRVVLGPWCVMHLSSSVNVIASSGVDFVIIDMEWVSLNTRKAYSDCWK